MNERNLNSLLKEKKIFFVGFMATGKTTIGKRLSNKLSLPFYDSDKKIESHLKMPVSNIFNSFGEKKFRYTEEKIILDHIFNKKLHSYIMSLGGGAFLNINIRNAIKLKGISVWLDANIEIIYNRVINSKNERPLLKNNNKEQINYLLLKRNEVYKEADLKVAVINTSKENMTRIIEEKILNHLKLKNA